MAGFGKSSQVMRRKAQLAACQTIAVSADRQPDNCRSGRAGDNVSADGIIEVTSPAPRGYSCAQTTVYNT